MIKLNGVEIKPTIFPDKTSQVWKFPNLHIAEKEDISWYFENEAEFLHIAQLKSLLDSFKVKTSLYIDYLPYGRQDKEITNLQTFALRPFCTLLNSLNFREITILDPHSKIALDGIFNSRATYPIEQILNAKNESKCDLFCYPDRGAYVKYTKIYEFPYIYGEKERDPLTGQILTYSLIGDCKNKNILIVDDICDGGATFIILAKVLKDAGAKSVCLFITHGLFTKGIEILMNAGIDRVFSKKGEHRP